MPNPYTGTENDPIQEAQHRYLGPDWDRFFGSLKGKNVRFAPGQSPLSTMRAPEPTGYLGPGPEATTALNYASAAYDDQNKVNVQNLRAMTADADRREAAAAQAKADVLDREALDRAYQGYGTRPSPIVGQMGGPYTARPDAAAPALSPAEARAQLLSKIPGSMRLAYEKQFAEQDLKAQAAQSPALKEFKDAQSQGYTGTFQQYQTEDANRKRPVNADTDAAMIDAAAKNILDNPRDLTSIRTITSLRGDQRLKLFNKIKEKNPDFNVGNIDRQIKFLDSYEDPKGRAASNRASMNNILMHSADLSDVNKDYGRSNVRLLNTPIAVLSKQGGEAWSRFQVPLSVLKDEISLYFAGGYAPTTDQQKTWDKIANDTATPAQVEQFAKDIIHVGLRRADTHNQQFKTMMGYDDPNLLTPDAVQAGVHLGLGESMKKYGSGGQIGMRAGGQAAAPAGASPTSGGGPKAGDIVTVKGQRVRVSAVHPDGTFDGAVVK